MKLLMAHDFRSAAKCASAVLLSLAIGGPALAQNPVTPAPKVLVAFNRFYDYAETVAVMQQLAAANPEVLRLRSIGKSFEGREMWLAVLADQNGTPLDRRPAMWIDANVHGNEIQGTEVCLYTLWFMTENRAKNPRIAKLLAENVFYILPSVNPDGRDWWFHGPNTTNSSRSGRKPIDDDRDGQPDEDGPNDLDGDGSICQMRKFVGKGGTHVPDPDEPRILRNARPDQEGTYVLLSMEGLDDDGDGAINEDGPGGYDLNRNWPTDWRPNHIQFGAGDYPLSHPEARNVADFILAHPNIAAVQSYHNTGGMILRGPGAKEYGEYPSQDVAVYDELGTAGEEMLPFYKYMVIWRDLYTVYGGFVNWCYEGLGIFALTNELWNTPQYYGSATADAADQRGERRLKWDERVELGDKFVPWRPFKHPFYGDIEIGGWKKDTDRIPPTFMLEELCHRNFAFTLFHAERMPRLEWDAPVVTEKAPGLWSVALEVRNRGVIPTRAAVARQKGIGVPDRLTIEVDAGRVVAGGAVVGPYGRERIDLVEHRPERLLFDGGIPGRGKIRVEWLVASATAPAPRLRFEAEKGGLLNR